MWYFVFIWLKFVIAVFGLLPVKVAHLLCKTLYREQQTQHVSLSHQTSFTVPPLDSSLKAAFAFISGSYMKGRIVTADTLTCSRFILEDLAVVVADIFNILSWGQREQPWHWIAEYVSIKSCLGKNYFSASCTLLLTWPANTTWSRFGQEQEKKFVGFGSSVHRSVFWHVTSVPLHITSCKMSLVKAAVSALWSYCYVAQRCEGVHWSIWLLNCWINQGR